MSVPGRVPVMAGLPHNPPPAEVTIDAALVASLLATQHPDLSRFDLGPCVEGWDNVTFRLGAELAVRLPRRAVAAPLIVHEQRWLPTLAEQLPTPVPTPVRTGVPSLDYPWAWSVVPWIEGSTALLTPLPDAEVGALGRFLRTLHSLPTAADAPRNPFRGGPLADRFEAVGSRLSDIAADQTGALRVADINAALRDASEAPIDSAPTWLHGDLHAKNVIVRARRLAGIVDWGDMCVGDPATDLSAVWILFDPSAHAGFWTEYGPVSQATTRRTLGWAMSFGTMLAGAHGTSDPAFADLGVRTLERVAGTL